MYVGISSKKRFVLITIINFEFKLFQNHIILKMTKKRNIFLFIVNSLMIILEIWIWKYKHRNWHRSIWLVGDDDSHGILQNRSKIQINWIKYYDKYKAPWERKDYQNMWDF